MMKDMFPAFTKDLMEGRDKARYFWIYYRYEDMDKCVPLVVNKANGTNLDPTRRIEKLPGEPVRLQFGELRYWYHLLDEFIANDSTLKVMIVDVEELYNEKVVMAVGKKSRWTVRAQYRHALNSIIVGGLPQHVSFAYAG